MAAPLARVKPSPQLPLLALFALTLLLALAMLDKAETDAAPRCDRAIADQAAWLFSTSAMAANTAAASWSRCLACALLVFCFFSLLCVYVFIFILDCENNGV
eukprot:m.319877 g.319877  ORF g.319877 m.319877 type:complete len:102 (+) comp23533_c0_seq1:649-954(+)